MSYCGLFTFAVRIIDCKNNFACNRRSLLVVLITLVARNSFKRLILHRASANKFVRYHFASCLEPNQVYSSKGTKNHKSLQFQSCSA